LQLKTFKSDEKLMEGRGLLLFQKFLQTGAFLDIEAPEDTVQKLQVVCDEFSKDAPKEAITKQLNVNFFDEAEDYALRKLYPHYQALKETQPYLEIMKARENASKILGSLEKDMSTTN
jgi:hypothetical protein